MQRCLVSALRSWPSSADALSPFIAEPTSNFRSIPLSMKDDLPRLQRYLRKMFSTDALTIDMHPKKTDMAEVMIGENFIGPIYFDEDEGEVSYQLQIAILDIDLEEV